jgi:bacterioferritin (cytochrome b1)
LKERAMKQLETEKVVAILNRLLEAELAGVVRYTHYSFMVFGFGRIPIVSWLRTQADESLVHAQQVGEWITTLGAYPSLEIGPLLDSHQTDIGAMLRESLDSERRCARSLPRAARRRGRRLGRARGVRAADDPRRGAARRGSRQDAEEARRRRGVRSAAV